MPVYRDSAVVLRVTKLGEADRILHAHDGAAVGETAFTGWWRRHLSHAFAFPELDV